MASARRQRRSWLFLRSIPPVPEEDDPNGWFHQIYDHLKRSPKERMERWVWFVDGALRYQNQLRGRPHVKFDPVRVLRTLVDHGVVFVVVGMGAGYLQGTPVSVLQRRHHPAGGTSGTRRGLTMRWRRWTPARWNGTGGNLSPRLRVGAP